MVSNASDDLPEPDSPVMTVRLWRGISTLMFLRLCSRAPRTINASLDIDLEASGAPVRRSTLLVTRSGDQGAVARGAPEGTAPRSLLPAFSCLTPALFLG